MSDTVVVTQDFDSTPADSDPYSRKWLAKKATQAKMQIAL